jgi:hypothetical protein
MNLIVKEFSRDTGTWANSVTFAATETHDTDGTSPYALDPADGGTGSALQIAAVMGRGGPTTGSFAGFDETTASTGNSIALFMGSDNVSGAGSLGASLTYTGGAEADSSPPEGEMFGLVLFIR